MQMHLFLGRIVLHDSSQNHDVIVKSVSSQMTSNEKTLNTYSVDSFRYDPSFSKNMVYSNSLYRDYNV